MSDMETLKEGDDNRIFAKGGSNTNDDFEKGREGDYALLDEEEEAEDDGKPRAGELKENTNIFKSAFHVFKANVGTGVFMLPTFYKDSGYIIAPILGVLIGFIVLDCTQLLLRTKKLINQKHITTYSKVVQYVFGAGMGWFLFAALVLTQFGFCLMFSQLLSASMDDMFRFADGKSHYLWVSLVLIICFPMTIFSDNLSLLGIGSLIATVCVIYALISCFISSCMKIHSNGGPHPTCNNHGENIPVGYFNTLANNMMVLEGIAVVLPVHAACTQKRLVPHMITIVLTCIITWYLLFGLTGYLAYGLTLKESLVNAMAEDAWGKSIRWLFIFNVLLSYPLQFMSAQQLIDAIFKCKPRSLVGLGIRLFINLVIWALAMSMPASAVNIVVAFIGAIPSCCMVMIIPGMLTLQIDYAVAHPDESRSSGHYWKMMVTGNGKFFTFKRLRAIVYIYYCTVDYGDWYVCHRVR
ncbi:solute carrier family 36 (proton-coupled amino acid transporter) [Angomonas deanei]|nr:solute carrier family 36 (proton-coupled amino acid transporter) [Angomonas deanei]|eukprot:EPY27978.1 solute carrier family 36 (proton-coupled amino acid transporter) [Angomonas deanei]